eukprot:15292657-Ditylum_brightwellii.AAC.1
MEESMKRKHTHVLPRRVYHLNLIPFIVMSCFEILHHPQCKGLFSTIKRNGTTYLHSCKTHPVSKFLLAKYEIVHVHQTKHVYAGIPPPNFVPEPSCDEEGVPPQRSANDISRLRESMGLSQKGPKPRGRLTQKRRRTQVQHGPPS